MAKTNSDIAIGLKPIGKDGKWGWAVYRKNDLKKPIYSSRSYKSKGGATTSMRSQRARMINGADIKVIDA